MIGKLLSLGPRGWWDLTEAQYYVFRAQAQLRKRPLGSLVSRAKVLSLTSPAGAIDARRAEARALARALDRVASHGFSRPLCLARSLALHYLLERRGIQGSEVRVGVRRAGTSLEAHAWVEWQGEVLGDDPLRINEFQQIDDLKVSTAAETHTRFSGTA